MANCFLFVQPELMAGKKWSLGNSRVMSVPLCLHKMIPWQWQTDNFPTLQVLIPTSLTNKQHTGLRFRFHTCITSTTPVSYRYYTSMTMVPHQYDTSTIPVWYPYHTSMIPVPHQYDTHTILKYDTMPHQYATSTIPVWYRYHTSMIPVPLWKLYPDSQDISGCLRISWVLTV